MWELRFLLTVTCAGFVRLFVEKILKMRMMII